MNGAEATPQPGGEIPPTSDSTVPTDDEALERLVDALEDADPAEAPDVAEELARRLAERIDDPGGAGGEV